jgi:hypothetical protein
MEITEEFIEELQSKFNYFLVDNFYSTERLTEVATKTGSITKQLFELVLKTGTLSGSTAKVYYDSNFFNPHYSTAFFRMHFNSLSNTFAFVGFKKTYADPTWDMTESHAGLMLREGKIYLSTANELGVAHGQQRTEISGIDLTRDFIIKIEKNKLSSMPLPQIIPYFDTFRIIAPDRIWTLKVTNSTYPPEDTAHYIMFFISNTTNNNKEVALRHFCYLEEYAD